jgi:hypothetical protein
MSLFKLSDEAKKYWGEFGRKCLDNLASVKVWFFMFPFVVSTVGLAYLIGMDMHIIKTQLEKLVADPTHAVAIIKQMEIITNMFIAWCTFNVSLAGTVIVVRETFKVKKLTALNDEKRDNSEVIERIKP